MIRELEFRVGMIPLHIITIVLNSIYAFNAIKNQDIVWAIIFIIFMTMMAILYFINTYKCNSIIKYFKEIEELAIKKYNEQKSRD